MTKKFILLAYLITCQLSSRSQTHIQLVQQQRIDSLRKILPSLKSTVRVDCLNELAGEYGATGEEKNKDSLYYYSQQAHQEAIKAGYQYGEAIALIDLAWFEINALPPKQNLIAAERHIDQALLIGEKIKSDKILGWCYLRKSGIISHKEGREAVSWLKKAQNFFQKATDNRGELRAATRLCVFYSDEGKYEEAFEYCARCVQLAKLKDPKPTRSLEYVMRSAFWNLGDLYMAAGDYPTALDYLRQLDHYDFAIEDSLYLSIGKSEIFSKMGEYDSAMFYWHRWKKNWNRYSPLHQAWGNNILGQIYLKSKQYDSALRAFEASMALHNKSIGSLLGIARVHVEKRKWNVALRYATNALSLSQKSRIRSAQQDAYELLSEINHGLGKDEEAYSYLLKYSLLQDSMLSKQFLWRLSNNKKIAEQEKQKFAIELLNKNNQIKEAQLKQETFLKRLWIAGFFVLVLAGTLFYGYRQQYLKKIKEMEMTVKIRLEKERIAQDLHDNIGAQLTLLASGLSKAAKTSDSNKDQLKHLREDMNATMVELRDTIWAINKEDVALNEIEDRINTLFWRLKQTDEFVNYELVSTLNGTGYKKIRPTHAVNLFRIVQEAITNSKKHSEASTVTVKLDSNEHQFLLSINDNGKGFNTNANGLGEHYGLQNMRKRAEEIGADLKITSEPKKGTHIQVILSTDRPHSL